MTAASYDDNRDQPFAEFEECFKDLNHEYIENIEKKDKKYFISMKFRDIWRFAYITPTTKNPCWSYTEMISFKTVKEAEEWFKANEKELFSNLIYSEDYYKRDTLAIRKLEYVCIKEL